MSVKFPFFGGGVGGGGGGECRFYFYGRADFSEKLLQNNLFKFSAYTLWINFSSDFEFS